jgi:dipeptidyl aminopeptidase/acylaminoacyl peptidase
VDIALAIELGKRVEVEKKDRKQSKVEKQVVKTKWTQVTGPSFPLDNEVEARMKGISSYLLQVAPEGEKSDPLHIFEALLLMPQESAPSGLSSPTSSSSSSSSSTLPPLILVPHGGPHSNFTTEFIMGYAYLAVSGFALLLVNYRGSSAFGQAVMETLPGKCGAQDVKDCMSALNAVLKYNIVDPKQICVFGGSHGGFLTTHLIGQYPDVFVSAATRNPVVNIAHMAACTDIPDWCFSEVGLPYNERTVPSPDDYALMFRCSPIAHLQRVKTPILIMLGNNDWRVPMTQSLDYYKALKARGVQTRMLVYPDAQHSLNDRISIEADVWVNTFFWLARRFEQKPDLKILS